MYFTNVNKENLLKMQITNFLIRELKFAGDLQKTKFLLSGTFKCKCQP